MLSLSQLAFEYGTDASATAFDCLVNEESEISRDLLDNITLPIKNGGLN